MEPTAALAASATTALDTTLRRARWRWRLRDTLLGVAIVVGATLVDGTGRAPVADSVVVLEGDRIVAAGPRAAVKVPKGARTIDARGKWIVPGLWDMHAHFQQVEWGPVYLAAGVTTVRDCANELDFVVAARDAIASGKGIGPRLLLAGVVDSDSPMAIGIQRAKERKCFSLLAQVLGSTLAWASIRAHWAMISRVRGPRWRMRRTYSAKLRRL